MRFDSWNDELYHHGVKGQKWGVRRTLEELGHITEAGGKTGEAIGRLAGRGKKNQSIKNMSDEELRKRLNRLNMEKQYSDLTKNNRVARGVEAVKDVLAIAGGTLAIAVSGMKIYEGVSSRHKK